MRTRVLLLAAVVASGCMHRPPSAASPSPQVVESGPGDAAPPTTREVLSHWLALRDAAPGSDESCASWDATSTLTYGRFLSDILAIVAETHDHDGTRAEVDLIVEWKEPAILRELWEGGPPPPAEGAWQCDAIFRLNTEPDPWHAGLRIYLTRSGHERVGPVSCLFH